MPGENKFNLLLNTFNIVTIPPVLFFSMVYYTDILSMMLVNAMILFGLKGRSFLASIFGNFQKENKTFWFLSKKMFL